MTTMQLTGAGDGERLNPDLWRGRPGGPDIDALVAEHVYRWRKVRPDRRSTLPRNPVCTAFALEWEHERDCGGQTLVDNIGCVCHFTPRFSTDPAASRELCEYLRKQGWMLVVKYMPSGFPFLLGTDATRDPQVNSPHAAELQYLGHRLRPADELNDLQRYLPYRHPFSFAETPEMAVASVALEMAHAVSTFVAQQAHERRAGGGA